MHRRALLPSIVVVAGIALSGCFTSTADFQNDAEKFILEDEGLANAVDTTFTTAECEEPTDQNAGTTFMCDAVDQDGEQWVFEIVILESNEYEVNVSRFPDLTD
ncbi:MAG: hypothetical protein DRJ50_03375 [Actinobacteria bacterium]|nr:MAG: hypothetical protein DRJ50_03375 [Actinomycetota bacterium]